MKHEKPWTDVWIAIKVSNKELDNGVISVMHRGSYDQVIKAAFSDSGTLPYRICKENRSERLNRNLTTDEKLILYKDYTSNENHSLNLRKRHVSEDPVNKYARIT